MLKPYLLDTNVLVALLWPPHSHHKRAIEWFVENRQQGWVTCPITETGFVRVVSNPVFSRDALPVLTAMRLLALNTASKDHSFWPADLRLDAVSKRFQNISGHKQLTGAYLFALACAKDGVLVSFDKGIPALCDKSQELGSAVQILE